VLCNSLTALTLIDVIIEPMSTPLAVPVDGVAVLIALHGRPSLRRWDVTGQSADFLSPSVTARSIESWPTLSAAAPRVNIVSVVIAACHCLKTRLFASSLRRLVTSAFSAHCAAHYKSLLIYFYLLTYKQMLLLRGTSRPITRLCSLHRFNGCVIYTVSPKK